ncbi:hypothetical protein [Paenibacillus sp. JMULE4]|uniref:hypothetical protein n=1 Tax=Paenibacillus sp. JMULE4 TaxID=2518342 RepID=UPI001575EAF8|nr:hypothetical protein [Paenibacillus sp. JMULE4]
MKKENTAPKAERPMPVQLKVFIPAERMAAALRHLIPGVILRLEREAHEKEQQKIG